MKPLFLLATITASSFASADTAHKQHVDTAQSAPGMADASDAYNNALKAKQQEKRIAALKQENNRLSVALARLTQNQQIDQQAIGKCSNDLKSLQSKLAKKTQSNAFYKRIISPEDGRAGVRVDDFQLKNTTVKSVYHYKATLIQTLRHARDTSGSVTMYLTGLQNGGIKRLTLTDVSITNTSSHRYRFKYHQTLKGDIKIPKAFSPLRLELRIQPAKQAAAISQTFDWTEVAG